MAATLSCQGIFRSDRRWQDLAVKRSPPVGDGKIFIQSFPRHSSVARFSLDVFQIELRTGKIPLLGNISLLCIQNELVLAKFARRVSEKPCNRAFGNTLCENIAKKDPPFSRPSCPNHAKRAYFAIPSRQTALMQAPDRPNPSIPGETVPPTPMVLPPGITLLMPHANSAPGRLHANAEPNQVGSGRH